MRSEILALVLALGACARVDGSGVVVELAASEDRAPDTSSARTDPPPDDEYGYVAAPLGSDVQVAPPEDTAGGFAVLDDGTAAVSADVHGALRFWPALDGSREPVIVPARRAVALAIARDAGSGDGSASANASAIAIGALDSLGQLEVIRVAPARAARPGAELARVQIDAPRPFVELRASGRGFIARRDDEQLVWIDLAGTARGTLPAPPGERIVAIVERSDRVLAIAERGRKRFGRWLELGPDELAWGDETAALPAGDGDYALAPSGRALLAPDGDGKAELVDLATGHATQLPTWFEGDWHVVGFVADRHAIVRDNSNFAIWDVGQLMTIDYNNRLGDGLVSGVRRVGIATDRGLVASGGASLVVTNGGEPHWLGYQMTEVDDLVPRGGGWVATDGSIAVHLDAALRYDRGYELLLRDVTSSGAPPTFELVDDRHVLADSSDGDGFAVYDLDHPDADPVPVPRAGRHMQLERSTGLAVIYGARTAEIYQYDRATHAFSGPIETRVHRDESAWATVLVDPAVAHGAIAFDIDPSPENPTLLDVTPLRRVHGVIEAGKTRRELEADGSPTPGPTIPAELMPDPMSHHASPDGTKRAELASGRLVVTARGGGVLWSRPADGATKLAWTANGELLAFGNGLARLDAATGAYLARRCGWKFGLWDAEPPFVAAPALCEE